MKSALRNTLLALAAAGALAASPLAVLESSYPDFSNISGAPTAIGALDVGSNTITGHVGLTLNADPDFFSITMPGGLSIVSVSINIPLFGTSFGNSASKWELLGPNGGLTNFTATGTYGLGGLAINSSPLVFGLEPGTGGVVADSFDYVVTITVQSAVPEPATWVLAAAGLAAVSLLRRRTA